MHTKHAIDDVNVDAQAPAPTQSGGLGAHELNAMLDMLLAHSSDGVVVLNHKGRVIDANNAICVALGYARESLMGVAFSTLTAPPFSQAHSGDFDTAPFAKAALQTLYRFNGTEINTQIISQKIAKNQLCLLIKRLPENSEQAFLNTPQFHPNYLQEVTRLSSLYNALSQINQAITNHHTRKTLLNSICKVLANNVGFTLAWVGWLNPETRQLEPIAAQGAAKKYIKSIKVYADERPEGCGPSGIAFRTEQPFICNDSQHNPMMHPWRAAITRYDIQASAAFPILQQGKVMGVLSVYTNKAFYFQQKEVALIAEAAKNIAFALDNLIRQDALSLAEKNVRDERQFSNTMIESMPGILYFHDCNGTFLRWNKNFETVTGYRATEIANMQPTTFFCENDRNALNHTIEKAFATGEASVEAHLINQHGQAVPYFFKGQKVVFNGIDCLVSIGIDITERKRAEAHLIESEKKYRALVELANSIILRCDRQGNITFLNGYGQRFFGYSEAEIIGRKLTDTIVPTFSTTGENLALLIEEILQNPSAFEQNINENICRNGQRVTIEWRNQFVTDTAGKTSEIVSIGTDISARIRTQQAIQELNTSLEARVLERTEALNKALERAEAADQSKSFFLATMSHEFRTPLNSIIGFTGIILQGLAGPLNPEQRKQLGMVRTSAKYLLELINDVIDISKIEAGQLEIQAEHFDVMESINRVMEIVQPFAEKKQLSFRKELALDSLKTTPMKSDRRRIEQILMNLLNNAIKFTEQGEVFLRAEVMTHTFANQPPQATLKISVSDTGIGIKPEDLSRLFQAFHQVNNGLARQYDGTGLGLTICRRLATLLGGTMTATSLWMQGTTMMLMLPVRLDA